MGKDWAGQNGADHLMARALSLDASGKQDKKRLNTMTPSYEAGELEIEEETHRLSHRERGRRAVCYKMATVKKKKSVLQKS